MRYAGEDRHPAAIALLGDEVISKWQFRRKNHLRRLPQDASPYGLDRLLGALGTSFLSGNPIHGHELWKKSSVGAGYMYLVLDALLRGGILQSHWEDENLAVVAAAAMEGVVIPVRRTYTKAVGETANHAMISLIEQVASSQQ
ncbi:hypothetical protein FWD20_04055 [Candidatus Saccharibacteria bacterium]|nr:hypothetical protein [Candidatus Saccharibacteria bacterium]